MAYGEEHEKPKDTGRPRSSSDRGTSLGDDGFWSDQVTIWPLYCPNVVFLPLDLASGVEDQAHLQHVPTVQARLCSTLGSNTQCHIVEVDSTSKIADLEIPDWG
jgi:hypothetical protein